MICLSFLFLDSKTYATTNFIGLYPEACTNRVNSHPGNPQFSQIMVDHIPENQKDKSHFMNFWAYDSGWSLFISENDKPLVVGTTKSTNDLKIGWLSNKNVQHYSWNETTQTWTFIDYQNSIMLWNMLDIGNCIPYAQNLDYTALSIYEPSTYRVSDYIFEYTPPIILLPPKKLNIVVGVQGNSITVTALSEPAEETETITRYLFWVDMPSPLPSPLPTPDYDVTDVQKCDDNNQSLHFSCSDYGDEYGNYRGLIKHNFASTIIGKHTVYVTALSSNGKTLTNHFDYTLGTFTADGTIPTPFNTKPEVIVCGDWDIPCKIIEGLKFLFIPNSDDLSTIFDDFNSDTHNIGQIILLPLTSITTLTTSSCSSIIVPIPFVGSNLTLDCLKGVYETNLGTTWVLLQGLLTGVIAYSVTINSIALIKQLKDPDDDKIEVFKL